MCIHSKDSKAERLKGKDSLENPGKGSALKPSDLQATRPPYVDLLSASKASTRCR